MEVSAAEEEGRMLEVEEAALSTAQEAEEAVVLLRVGAVAELRAFLAIMFVMG